MDMDRSGDLVVVEVRWEQKPGKRYLLGEVFDLLLRDPDLIDRDTPDSKQQEVQAEQQGSER